MKNINASKHAIEQWAYRFGHLDMVTEYRNAIKPSASVIKKINVICDYSIKNNPLPDAEYLISTNNVIFVMGHLDRIITVFPYVEPLLKRTMALSKKRDLKIS